jgi:hypothetical protein
MNDFDERAVSAAEADFERLLSVEPSPEFAAKVRARVAEERMNRPEDGAGSARWRLAAAVDCGWWSFAAAFTKMTFAFSTAAPADTVLSLPNGAPNPVSVAPGPMDDRPQVRHATVSQQKAEIIIDPAIGDAIRRLAVATRNTTLDASKARASRRPIRSPTFCPSPNSCMPELVLGPVDPDGGQ